MVDGRGVVVAQLGAVDADAARGKPERFGTLDALKELERKIAQPVVGAELPHLRCTERRLRKRDRLRIVVVLGLGMRREGDRGVAEIAHRPHQREHGEVDREIRQVEARARRLVDRARHGRGEVLEREAAGKGRLSPDVGDVVAVEKDLRHARRMLPHSSGSRSKNPSGRRMARPSSEAVRSE